MSPQDYAFVSAGAAGPKEHLILAALFSCVTSGLCICQIEICNRILVTRLASNESKLRACHMKFTLGPSNFRSSLLWKCTLQMWNNICSRIFIVASFIIAKWDQIKCSILEDWLGKPWCVYETAIRNKAKGLSGLLRCSFQDILRREKRKLLKRMWRLCYFYSRKMGEKETTYLLIFVWRNTGRINHKLLNKITLGGRWKGSG